MFLQNSSSARGGGWEGSRVGWSLLEPRLISPFQPSVKCATVINNTKTKFIYNIFPLHPEDDNHNMFQNF